MKQSSAICKPTDTHCWTTPLTTPQTDLKEDRICAGTSMTCVLYLAKVDKLVNMNTKNGHSVRGKPNAWIQWWVRLNRLQYILAGLGN